MDWDRACFTMDPVRGGRGGCLRGYGGAGVVYGGWGDLGGA